MLPLDHSLSPSRVSTLGHKRIPDVQEVAGVLPLLLKATIPFLIWPKKIDKPTVPAQTGGPLLSLHGTSCLLREPSFEHQGEQQNTRPRHCSEQTQRGKQRSTKTAPKEERKAERRSPPRFFGWLWFQTLIAPQGDEIRDSHIETP